jgi:HK97 family phage prohead protease
MLNKLHNPLAQCNLKFDDVGAVNADDNGIFAGYASVFGGIDSFGDTIMKGAFAETLENMERMPLMLYGHDSQNVIGKWLKMDEDEKGLWVEGEFTPNHSLASDVYASARHGAIDGMSIGFSMGADDYEELENGGRRINKIELFEVSIVGFPADDSARVSQVKMSDEIKNIETIREAERFLRDAGLPISMAKAFISQCRPMFQREADLEREQKEALERDREWLRNLINSTQGK